MMCEIIQRALGAGIALALATAACATSVPSLTFEELTDKSAFVLTGQVNRSWTAWDNEHKFIWTYYEIGVTSVQKGAPGPNVVVSEPGGVVGDRGMSIPGSVAYAPGDRVALFLQRMPNGYLRTTGWGQGKYVIDPSGHLHVDTSLRGLEVVHAVKAGVATPPGTSLRALDGISVAELGVRVSARVRAQRQAAAK